MKRKRTLINKQDSGTYLTVKRNPRTVVVFMSTIMSTKNLILKLLWKQSDLSFTKKNTIIFPGYHVVCPKTCSLAAFEIPDPDCHGVSTGPHVTPLWVWSKSPWAFVFQNFPAKKQSLNIIESWNRNLNETLGRNLKGQKLRSSREMLRV